METAKALLERFYDLTHKKQSGMNVFAELQELGDMAQKAIDELYQAEIDMESTHDLLSAYERGVAV